MFIRFCFGSWGCGSEYCGFARDSRPYRVFLSPSHGTKNPSMSVIAIFRQLTSSTVVSGLPTTGQNRTGCAGYNCAQHGPYLWHKTRALRNPVAFRVWRDG